MPAVVAALRALAIAFYTVQFVADVHAMRGSRLTQGTDFAVAAAAAGKMLDHCECCDLLVGHVYSPYLFRPLISVKLSGVRSTAWASAQASSCTNHTIFS